jgi:hypothetical protein
MDELRNSAYTLNNTAIKYSLKISVNKTKAVAMKGKMTVRNEIVMNSSIIEHVNSVNYLGYTITVSTEI